MREWLKEFRENNGLTQLQVAHKSNMSESYYNMIENGERGRNLPADTAKAIASVLGFDWTKFYEAS